MNEIKLTKDTNIAICLMYKEYLNKIESGVSKSDARGFTGQAISSLLPNYSDADINQVQRELKEKLNLKLYAHKNCTFSDDCIIYMENRFPTVKDFLDYVTKALGIAKFFV